MSSGVLHLSVNSGSPRATSGRRLRVGGRPPAQLQVHRPVVAHDATKVFDWLELVAVGKQRLALNDERGEHAGNVRHADVRHAERHLRQAEGSRSTPAQSLA